MEDGGSRFIVQLSSIHNLSFVVNKKKNTTCCVHPCILLQFLALLYWLACPLGLLGK
jgi:hypothetical protein